MKLLQEKIASFKGLRPSRNFKLELEMIYSVDENELWLLRVDKKSTRVYGKGHVRDELKDNVLLIEELLSFFYSDDPALEAIENYIRKTDWMF